jgi:DNA-binding NarL/FixJ family response regulator
MSAATDPGDRSCDRAVTVVLGRFGALLGRGLEEVLREDEGLRIVATDLDGPDLERAVAQRAPRVAVLDETSAAEPSALKRLQAAQPGIGIVVLTHRPTRALGVQLLAAGATCLPDDAVVADVRAAVHLAAQGKRLCGPLADLPAQRDPHAGTDLLTRRELEVLERLRLKQPNAEIAHALGISIETVRTHAARVRRKLGVKSKWELAGPVSAPTEAEQPSG